MVTHIVLFRPKVALTEADRRLLIESLRRAINEIALIRRATIGRRVKLNRSGYEALMREHYDYSAIFEFDSEADLRSYLDHPAHSELGKLLFASADAVLAYDFVSVESDEIT